jgi:hypothetical protein
MDPVGVAFSCGIACGLIAGFWFGWMVGVRSGDPGG